jgi:uncharacterized protein (TIGR04141 family)
MAEKTKPFSIFLLKEGFDASNALDDEHALDEVETAKKTPNGSTLYIFDTAPKPPWWKEYLGIRQNLMQTFKGALLFLPVGDRCFALTFGNVSHNMKDNAYEYDFGLLVTLNSLDPEKLKSADMVEPGAARRKRTQVPISTELTYLDFDGNSEILKSLTGKVKKRYEGIFKNVTGSTSLKVSLKIAPDRLEKLCNVFLKLYRMENYKNDFPNIQNIVPIKDPDRVDELDGNLVRAFHSQDASLTLTIPDIIDYRDFTCCMFSGRSGPSEIYPDISIEQLYDYLGPNFDLAATSIEQLKKFRLILTDADGNPGDNYSVYRSLLFETSLAGDGNSYHLCEGGWYKVEADYVQRLRNYLDGKCENSDLAPYNHDEVQGGKSTYSEGKYNTAIPVWQNHFICLDRTDISPAGNTAIEPCDLYSVPADSNRATLYHIKISTRSTQLSHLFNQGVNSLELISLDEQAKEKLKQLIRNDLHGNDEQNYLAPITADNYKVVFAIVTHKDPAARSNNLPLFSKISLRRNMQRLDLMKAQSALMFVEDQSPPKGSFSKYKAAIVQVYQSAGRKKVARPIVGQGLDVDAEISSIPREIRDAPVGSRFRIHIREMPGGELTTNRSWPIEQV